MFYKCKICGKYLPVKAYMYQPTHDFYNICRKCINEKLIEYNGIMEGLKGGKHGT